MHDRRAYRALSDIAALRVAERAAAYQELADARLREREAADAASRADGRVAAAVDAWHAHLAGSDFAPELACALADELVSCGKRATVAREHQRRTAHERSECERAWHAGDARCRLADRARADSERALRRDRDGRALAALADRTATKWRHA